MVQFFLDLKKKKSRGFIFIVRKYRGHSVHNLTPFSPFFCLQLTTDRIASYVNK